MSDAFISLYCPSMKINRLHRGLRITDPEPMIATVLYPDGSKLIINPVTIPKTYVYKLGFLRWMVSSCVGEGSDEQGNRVVVYLPEQPTVFILSEFAVVALPIVARVVLSLRGGNNGRILHGSVVFPSCKVRNPLFHPVADEVETLGGDLTIISH